MTELKDIADSLSYIVDKKKVKRLPRSYLGMSQLGHNCGKYLWFYFHWADHLKFSPRNLRIFAAGNDTETIIIDELKKHFEITGSQDELVHCGGFIKGHTDGSIKGLPEIESEEVLLEAKSMKETYWKSFVKNCLKVSHKGYYDQSQVYGFLKGHKKILEVCLNKNTSELAYELLPVDEVRAQFLLDRGEDIVFAKVPPKGLSDDPAYYECNWCDMLEVCHEQKSFIKTCRTCQYVQCKIIDETSVWYCNKHYEHLTLQEQKNACDDYNMMEI